MVKHSQDYQKDTLENKLNNKKSSTKNRRSLYNGFLFFLFKNKKVSQVKIKLIIENDAGKFFFYKNVFIYKNKNSKNITY